MEVYTQELCYIGCHISTKGFVFEQWLMAMEQWYEHWLMVEANLEISSLAKTTLAVLNLPESKPTTCRSLKNCYLPRNYLELLWSSQLTHFRN
ncbi:unnamed protein product [Cuscuta campestris]|uniref:Uncharacterized protein n=1 Tax=Cuscuta campestris TaxID=132261 RepID=A0A484LJP8_9ASTE|nr:unnamed protein product [Cuscuta campestris]